MNSKAIGKIQPSGFLLLLMSASAFLLLCQLTKGSQIYYVDTTKGTDDNSGNIAAPFGTLDKALQVVSDRVDAGIRSDKIFLRGGVYKKVSTKTLYTLNLRGAPDDYSIISAMPCEPNSPGGVQRKSGQWYENVVFDDGYKITTPWTRLRDNPHVWKTKPGYTRLEWIHRNLWPWTKYGYPITDKDDTPETTLFTVAPYMLLQDGEPFLWADKLEEITEPGMRYYDQSTDVLYIRPLGDKDPNTCGFESWYGGPEDYPVGTLHLDAEGRALFKGNLEYAAIRGFEFRMFNKLFEFVRRGYAREEDRMIQRHVLFEDNLTRYCWMNIVLDGGTVLKEVSGVILPRYSDRSDWLVRNNVFFRPAREVCQLHGDNHIFEYNEIIEHGGPWAGPASCVSIINTRHTRNMKIRFNYIFGQGNNKWHAGSVFMIETGKVHGDAKGDYRYGGQTYEYNIIANVTKGAAFVLGKGGIRMRNITIRHNIIAGNKRDPAIRISTPHTNLTIEHNVFYNQINPFQIYDVRSSMTFESLPSTISIRNNIFMHNKKMLDRRLLSPPAGSSVVIDRNLFFENQEPAVGTNVITGKPLFRDPANFDFRLLPGSAAIVAGHDLGAYDTESPVPPGTEWWRIKNGEYARQFLTIR